MTGGGMIDVPQSLLSRYVHNNLRASELPGVRRRCTPQKELEDERLGEDASGALLHVRPFRTPDAAVVHSITARAGHKTREDLNPANVSIS
ncbi:hypothetical protein AOLI_G00101600 [Acnodon oligacanthus]